MEEEKNGNTGWVIEGSAEVVYSVKAWLKKQQHKAKVTSGWAQAFMLTSED